MFVTPARTVYKVRFWDPLPGGNVLPDGLHESLFQCYLDMDLFFEVRKQLAQDSARVRMTMPNTINKWNDRIRSKARRLFYVYNDERQIIGIGETMRTAQCFYRDMVKVRVYVDPDYRRQGVGGALMAAIERSVGDDSRAEDADTTLMFDAFDPERCNCHDSAAWLRINNFTKRGECWVHGE